MEHPHEASRRLDEELDSLFCDDHVPQRARGPKPPLLPPPTRRAAPPATKKRPVPANVTHKLPAELVAAVVRFLPAGEMLSCRSACRALEAAAVVAGELEFCRLFGEHPAAVEPQLQPRVVFRMLALEHQRAPAAALELAGMCAARGLGRFIASAAASGMLPARAQEPDLAAAEQTTQTTAPRRTHGHEQPPLQPAASLSTLFGQAGTALVHVAAGSGHLQVARLLASAGSDMGVLSRSGRHACHYAAGRGHTGLVEYLLRWCPHPSSTPPAAAALPPAASGTEGADGALAPAPQPADSSGAAANFRDRDGCSVLFVAAQGGHADLVKVLVDAHGAVVDLASKDERTPLFAAAGNGHLEAVIALADRGASVDAACDTGKTALYAAAESGHAAVVAELLRRGANVRAETCRQKIPLYAAAELGHTEVVRLLLEQARPADLFKRTAYGTTPLSIASKAHPQVRRLFYILLLYCRRLRVPRGIPMRELDATVVPQSVLKIQTPMLIEDTERFYRDVDALAYALPPVRPIRTAISNGHGAFATTMGERTAVKSFSREGAQLQQSPRRTLPPISGGRSGRRHTAPPAPHAYGGHVPSSPGRGEEGQRDTAPQPEGVAAGSVTAGTVCEGGRTRHSSSNSKSGAPAPAPDESADRSSPWNAKERGKSRTEVLMELRQNRATLAVGRVSLLFCADDSETGAGAKAAAKPLSVSTSYSSSMSLAVAAGATATTATSAHAATTAGTISRTVRLQQASASTRSSSASSSTSTSASPHPATLLGTTEGCGALGSLLLRPFRGRLTAAKSDPSDMARSGYDGRPSPGPPVPLRTDRVSLARARAGERRHRSSNAAADDCDAHAARVRWRSAAGGEHGLLV